MPVVLALVLLLPAPMGCVSARMPGPVVAPFAPGPGYSGHWGIDFEVAVGAPVTAVLPGRVVFAGLVVDNLAVTVEHGGGIRTSYSYLQELKVPVGEWVERGDVVGRAGWAHDRPGLHLSLRLEDRYVDPIVLFGCQDVPGPALRLVSRPARSRPYAVRRAARHSGRNLRSTSRGPPHGG